MFSWHQPKVTKTTFIIIFSLIALITAMGIQMVLIARLESATYDEPIHLLSGYATDKYHHTLFDPEHPFLIKAYAALPLLFMHPIYQSYVANLTPAERSIGYNILDDAIRWSEEFLYLTGNPAGHLLFAARLMMIALTLVTSLIVFLWTKRLWGLAPGLIVLTLFAFEPSFIAHGLLVNDDVATALFYLLGIATFYHFLNKPTSLRAIIAGLVFGLALITKFSLILLAPTYVLMTAFYLWPHQIKTKQWWQSIGPYALGFAAICLLGLATIWATYGTFHLINPSQNPIGHPPTSGWLSQVVADLTPGLYAKGAINILPTPFAVTRDAYLLGQCYQGSRWQYFPVLLVTKPPLPILILFFLTLLLYLQPVISRVRAWLLQRFHPASNNVSPAAAQSATNLTFLPNQTALVLLLPALTFLTLSVFSNINIGFRHILPVYLLLLIFTAQIGNWINWSQLKHSKTETAKAVLILGLILWAVVDGLRAFPNDLPYFNEISGEPRPLPYIAYDSNVDWGQSLKQLQAYLTAHHIKTIALDNYNPYTAADYYHLPYTRADPTNHHYHGWIAISRSKAIDRHCKHLPNWDWLTATHQPVTIIGNAIDLYYLP